MCIKAFLPTDSHSQYYLSEADVGKNRASVCVEKLAELNNYVKVTPSTVELTDDFLKQFQVRHLAKIYDRVV